MKRAEPLLQLLRNRIVSALHLGLAQPGDALPSIRELSRELGVDHRALARAYRALEAEGLVEVRERAGVYFAEPRRLAGGLPEETVEWLGATLAEAWRRRLDAASLQHLIRRATQTGRPRCVLAESTEDHLVGWSQELAHAFPLEVVPVGIPPRAVAPGEPSPALVQAVRCADLVATSPYHAAHVRPVAEAHGKPLVVMEVDPVALERIDRLMSAGTITLIACDPLFRARIKAAYAARGIALPADALLIVSEGGQVPELDPARTVLVTRAARREIKQLRFSQLLAEPPTLSTTTIRALADVVIRHNLAAAPITYPLSET